MQVKTKLYASLVPVLLTSSLSAFAAAPAPVTIHGGQISFTGEVVATPCAVNNDSDNQTVKLGQVAAGTLATAGATSAEVPFSIELTGCDLTGAEGSDNYTKAAITFSGNTVSGNPQALSVTSADGAAGTAATNVGIQIMQDGAPVSVDGSQASTAKDIVAGSNNLAFSAAYISTAENVTAGVANATADFTVTYE